MDVILIPKFENQELKSLFKRLNDEVKAGKISKRLAKSKYNELININVQLKIAKRAKKQAARDFANEIETVENPLSIIRQNDKIINAEKKKIKTINKQIDTSVDKYERKQKEKDLNNFINKIESFKTNTDSELTLSIPNAKYFNELKKHLSNVHDKILTIKSGNQIYTLNDKHKKLPSALVYKSYSNEDNVGSDTKITSQIFNTNGNVILNKYTNDELQLLHARARRDTLFEREKKRLNKILNKLETQQKIKEEKKKNTELLKIEEKIKTARKNRNRKYYQKQTSGAFFPYLNTTKYNLKRYGIFPSYDKHMNNSCLVYAIQMSNRFTEIQVNSVKATLLTMNVTLSSVKSVAECLKCDIQVRTLKNVNTYKYTGINLENANPVLKLGLISDHYFLNEEINSSAWVSKNYKQLEKLIATNKKLQWMNVIGLKNGKPIFLNKRKHVIMSFDLIKNLLETQCFKPIDQTTVGLLNINTINQRAVQKNYSNLNYDSDAVKSLKELNTKNEKPSYIGFGDTETTTDKVKHNVYLANLIMDDGARFEFRGRDSCIKFLNSLKSDSLIYFHNLKYDWAQFTHLEGIIILDYISTGTMLKLVRFMWFGNKITFKDSYCMISAPLSKFASMFGLSVKKEIMPYEAYTSDAVELKTIKISQAEKFVKQADLAEFKILSSKYTNGDDFDHISYASFYCFQDCEVLKAGFNKFRDFIKQNFQVDVINKISLPGASNQILRDKGCFDKCFSMGLHLRTFIERSIVGGRCMTRDNKKWRYECEDNEAIQDFDAVSLYPSAMKDMGFLIGKPKVLEPHMLNYSWLENKDNGIDGYFIEINNIKVNKPQHFPLLSTNFKGLGRNFTNEFKAEDVIVINKIDAEDFVKYQGGSFNIIKGYYFNEGRNYKIGSVISQLFNERLKLKSEGNPLETVIKLLLNASYGKCCQKAIEHKTKFTHGNAEYLKCLHYHQNNIISITDLRADNHMFKLSKQTNKHFNECHIASEILSYSKRIMNRVMCLAEDLNIPILYQDTDSMHIVTKIEKENNTRGIRFVDIDRLSSEFKKIYDRDLIGKQMGCFHSDFACNDHKSDTLYSTLFIACGKKVYCDRLSCGHYHKRMKGVSDNAINSTIKKLGIDKKEDYLLYDILNNDVRGVSFDLADCGKPSFELSKGLDYTTREHFIRNISFNNVYGKII